MPEGQQNPGRGSDGEEREPTVAAGDPVEGRGCRVMEPWEGKMTGTPSPATISTRLQRIGSPPRPEKTLSPLDFLTAVREVCVRPRRLRQPSSTAENVPPRVPQQRHLRAHARPADAWLAGAAAERTPLAPGVARVACRPRRHDAVSTQQLALVDLAGRT